MIPQRVKLSGFLSYKNEQEIRFDGSPLWMLSGTNGSGKSSIFDAVTYALFGHHRGGRLDAVELINKESNTLAVEFDFTLEGQLYRIKRTVRRRPSGVASTQQVMRQEAGDWAPVPDTQLKAKFDAWIKDKIGLDYDTFTSSVLLLQGKSEKLLDSTPSGRAGVLARIVDLERYQKLHAKADDRRRELRGQHEAISNQLAGIRDVSDEELAAAGVKIEECQEHRDRTQVRIDELHALELQARRWTEARAKLSATNAKLANAESLLGHAVAIEKDYARLRELRDVLPAVGTIVTERGRIGESERKTDQLTRDRESAGDRRRQTEHAVDQAKKKRVALQKTLAEDEAKLERLNGRLRELAAVLEKVRQVEAAQAEVKHLEDDLKRLPPDPDSAVRKLQEEQERLVVLAQHIALLERLHQDRVELTKAVADEKQARDEEKRLTLEGKKAKEELEALQVKLKAAREAREKNDQAAAEARAMAAHTRQLADEFKQLTGEKACRACGQPLTPEHFAAEKKKRDLDAVTAARKYEALTSAATTARAAEDELAHREATDREKLTKLREDFTAARGTVKQHAGDIKRLADSCRQTFFALPDEFKRKVGPREPDDWTKATYPDRRDISELGTEAKEIDGVRRKLRDAQDTATKAASLRAKLDSARDRLARTQQGLPASDSSALRQEETAKKAEETTLAASVKGGKKEIQSVEQLVEREQRVLGETDRELTRIAGELNTEEVSRRQSHETVERAKKILPAEWQKRLDGAGMGERLKWTQELEDLQRKDTEKKHTHLQAARTGLESLRAEIQTLEEEAAAFPPEARRSPDEVKADVTSARKELDARNRSLLEAQAERRELERLRAQRGELGAAFRAVDADLNRAKLLTELLGRDRLQRHLVRQAERQIVDYANSVLDRLSGGQLFLKLVEADAGTDKALDLECSNRVTGGAAINVAFLSGSQRFRVAVALALGIGQYASKQHRPIESVIIDEGFGCLDRAGRQVMIQELQNLRGHLHCILLVSHQEEFADAFPDGYRFELDNGATRVTRFVR
jgi:exonuclease SbcC